MAKKQGMEVWVSNLADTGAAGGPNGSTLTSQLLAASSTYTIPAGKSFYVNFQTGTGTFNGIAVSAGFSRSGRSSSPIVVTTNAASTAYIDTSN